MAKTPNFPLNRPALAAAFLLASIGQAQPKPATGQSGESPPEVTATPPGAGTASGSANAEKLRQAKSLFRIGNSLRKAGDCQRALEFYLKSRALVPSIPNTLNAAYCLDKLKRDDEALEHYEAVLTEFHDKLTPELRAQLGPQLEALRNRTASLDVGGNVTGAALVIDGRQRGTLPMSGAIRVLPGGHTVRVIKDGYSTFEQKVKLKPRQTLRIDAKLQPLAESGKLRVDAAGGQGAELFVDGVMVGKLPWEGTLAPGRHLYFVQKGERGSAPAAVVVLRGQTALAEPVLRPLGPPVRFLIEPTGSVFYLNEVEIGDNTWRGRLPLGAHRLRTSQEGYFAKEQQIDITEKSGPDIVVRLEVNPDHPRWAKPTKLSFGIDLFGALALGPSLGGDVDSSCDRIDCTDRAGVTGAATGLRASLEIPIRLRAELAAGYLRLDDGLKRSYTDNTNSGSDVRYDLSDDLRVSGPFVSAGIGYRLALSTQWGAGVRAHAGALLSTTTHDVAARLSAGGDTIDGRVEGSGKKESNVSLFLWPEVYGSFAPAPTWQVGVGVGALWLPSRGQEGAIGDVLPTGSTGVPSGARGSGQIKGQRPFGSSVIFLPTVFVSKQF